MAAPTATSRRTIARAHSRAPLHPLAAQDDRVGLWWIVHRRMSGNLLLRRHDSPDEPFLRARFGWAGNGWDLDLTDGTHLFFPESYNGKRAVDGAVVEFKSAKGEAIRIERDKARNLRGLFPANRQFLKFDYDSRNRMIRAYDHGNRMIHYTYDLAGRLVLVQSGTSTRRYSYHGTYLSSVQENGQELFQFRYDRGRIAELALANKQVYKLRYDYHPRDDYTVIRTYLTAPDGTVTEFEDKPK